MSEPKFFLVWNPAGRSPFCQHGTYQSARTEAERLARANPNQDFYVVVPMGRARKTDVEYEEYLNPDDIIPF